MRLPHLAAGKSIAAVIRLRGAQLRLSAMKQICTLAARSSRFFKISLFDESVFYVAMADLEIKPTVNNFVVLSSDFHIRRAIPVNFVHADIYPSSICW